MVRLQAVFLSWEIRKTVSIVFLYCRSFSADPRCVSILKIIKTSCLKSFLCFPIYGSSTGCNLSLKRRNTISIVFLYFPSFSADPGFVSVLKNIKTSCLKSFLCWKYEIPTLSSLVQIQDMFLSWQLSKYSAWSPFSVVLFMVSLRDVFLSLKTRETVSIVFLFCPCFSVDPGCVSILKIIETTCLKSFLLLSSLWWSSGCIFYP